MITKQLINPQSIVVVGGSNDIHKPGGKVLKNLLEGNFKGDLYVLNPKADEVQGVKSYRNIEDLPNTDLAIIAIAAKYTPQTVEYLAANKNTRAFIILSAGFSEESEEGKRLEEEIVNTVNKYKASLIGPNCIGFLNTNYNGVFTTPIPKLDPKGIDMISGSGATAVFIMEAALPKGLTFNSVWSVGNSAQIGVEDVLEYLDQSFDPEKSSRVKILYLEQIKKPQKLLKHAKSLIEKGCKIAAIKAGYSEAGQRAASSHTGALASSDIAVDALFRKAGIVRCYGREELVNVAAVFQQKELKGKRIAVITHAGGPGVMLTDVLSKGGMEVPPITGEKAQELKTKLFPGSSVANPIDFLATGTAEQLGTIIDYCNLYFDNIDGMAVIFGTPGLFRIFDVYEVLHEKMQTSPKPIYPILPSTKQAKEEIEFFQSKGHQSFNDEVMFGLALTKVYNTPKPFDTEVPYPENFSKEKIKSIVEQANSGYLTPEYVGSLLDAAGIARVKEILVRDIQQLDEAADDIGFPCVMKVVGPIHKSDVGGVSIGIKNIETLRKEFTRMMKIPEAKGVLIQQMVKGLEIFIGAKYEKNFGHILLVGMGGIFVEVLKDVMHGLAPIGYKEAISMIKSLRSYKILEGVRGQQGIDIDKLAEIITRVSLLVSQSDRIKEMDINPLIGYADTILAVDARIRVE